MEKWEKELRDAGWTRTHANLWKSPFGKLYRGPYFAWRVMQSIQQWGLKQCTDCGEVASAGGNVEHGKGCSKGDTAVLIIHQGIFG